MGNGNIRHDVVQQTSKLISILTVVYIVASQPFNWEARCIHRHLLGNYLSTVNYIILMANLSIDLK